MKKKTKVIQMTPFFYPVQGGMEDHVFDTSLMLKSLGYDVEIFSSNKLRQGKIKTKHSIYNGIKVTRFNSIFHVTQLAPIWPGVLLRMVFENYDVLHMHSYRHQHNLCGIIAKLRGKKVILTPHWPEYPMNLRNKIVQKIIPMFDRTIGRLIFASCDMVFADTELEKQWLQDKFNIKKQKIKIITPGISKKEFIKHNPKPFLKKHNIINNNKKNHKIIVSMGRIHKSKGFDQLIKVANKFPKTKFVFVGPDGGDKQRLIELAQKLGVKKQIIFTGFLSDKERSQALASADVFCLPTQYEAFGIALAEAMAQSKPIIASNVGGVPWVIKGCGYTFENQNIEDLEKKLKLVLNNAKLKKQFSNNALKRAKLFTFDNIKKELQKAYKELIK